VHVSGLVLVDRLTARLAPPARLERRAADPVPERLAVLAPLAAPLGEEPERASEIPAARRQLVRVARRALRVGAGEHERLALEVPEALREDVRRDPDGVLKLPEAAWTAEKCIDEKKRPAVADARDGVLERRARRAHARDRRDAGRHPSHGNLQHASD
jgi:hypothetical protein